MAQRLLPGWPLRHDPIVLQLKLLSAVECCGYYRCAMGPNWQNYMVQFFLILVQTQNIIECDGH